MGTSEGNENLRPPSLGGLFGRAKRERAAPDAVSEAVPAPQVETVPDPEPEPPRVERVPPPAPAPAPKVTPFPAPASETPPEVHAGAESTRDSHVFAAVREAFDAEPPAVVPPSAPTMAEPEPPAPKQVEVPRAPAATPEPKTAMPAKDAKVLREPRPPRGRSQPATREVSTRRTPALPGALLAGAASGATLMGLIALFKRWGGESTTYNAFELLAAFLLALLVGTLVLKVLRIAHASAIAFLGTGCVALALVFFPSDRWQTLGGGIGIAVAIALLYAAAHAMSRAATGER